MRVVVASLIAGVALVLLTLLAAADRSCHALGCPPRVVTPWVTK